MKIIKKSKSKNAKLIILVLLVLFCIYNLFWYFGEYKIYNDLQKDFPEIESSGVKIYTDTDNIQYSVSVPNYLLWNGNLAIAEENVQYALIIWLKPFNQGTKQGIMFNGYNNISTQIMLKNSTTAEDYNDQALVNENQEVISALFDKANSMWLLGLE